MKARAHRAAALGLALLLGLAGLSAAPTARAGAAEGEPLYQTYCSQCHGETGEADGPAAAFVLPRPRVFADNATYKFRSTGSGELPTDQDIHRVIWQGIPGTSMPRFSEVLNDRQAWDLVAYLKSLAEDFSDPDLTVSALPMPELAKMKPVAATAESIATGKALYDENKCWQCHGAEGRGDGSSWVDLKDEWGDIILPADLTIPEHFRNGERPEDIYRTISTGLNGTPMPAYSDSIDTGDRWHLVNFILSLAPPRGERRSEVVIARRSETIPALDDEEAWAEFPQARFKTFANVVEAPRLYWPAVEFVMARAAYTKRELALRVQWSDRSQSEGEDAEGAYADRDGAIHHLTEHPDQLAVLFPTKNDPGGKRPYVMMGDRKRSVTAWWWRSDWGGVREITAKGWGSTQVQSGNDAEVEAELSWADGRYTLLLRRTLQTTGTSPDVEFGPGSFVPLAFQAWDGSRGEVGQRRSLTTWSWLYLEPGVPMGPLLAKSATAGGLVFLGLLVTVLLVRRRASATPEELSEAA